MARPFTPETLVYDFTAGFDPQVSPDGTRIAYVFGRVDRASGQVVLQLWLRDIDGGNPRQITWSQGRDVAPRWSPDGRALAFASDRGERLGLYVLPLNGGEAREIARHRLPLADFAWSPDGRRMAYTLPVDPANPVEAEPDPAAAPPVPVTRRIDYKQDGLGFLGETRRQLVVVDVVTGERRQLTHAARDHLLPAWSPDGRRIAVGMPLRNGMSSQLGIVDVAGGETVLIGPDEGRVGLWAWSPGGDRLFLAAEAGSTWHFDLMIHDLAAGATRLLVEAPPFLADAGFPLLFPPSPPVWRDERTVLLHGIRGGASGLYAVDTDSGRVDRLARWEAAHVGFSIDERRRVIAQSHGSLVSAGEIAVYDVAAGSLRVVTDHNASLLREHPPARWERFDVERDGFVTEAWLLMPPDLDPAKRHPVVLDVHGGPHSWYGYELNGVQQLLATNGFLVVYANPRGSGSYDRRFTTAVHGDWGGEDYRDLIAALDRVLETPAADPDRTGIFGYSYGGFMTAWAIGQTDRFKAAVCGAPVFDFASFYGTSDIGHTFGPRQWGRTPPEDREWIAAHSPSRSAHLVRTPTLILHPEADERCPVGQGEQLFVALHEAGCEVEFVRYPGASHLMLSTGLPAHRADFLTRTLGWFKRHLGEPS